jgi:hypothetical protein
MSHDNVSTRGDFQAKGDKKKTSRVHSTLLPWSMQKFLDTETYAKQCCGSGFNWSLDPDKGGQKWPTKIEKKLIYLTFEMLYVLFGKITAVFFSNFGHQHSGSWSGTGSGLTWN